jgi:hypothetical protein
LREVVLPLLRFHSLGRIHHDFSAVFCDVVAS